MHYTFELGPIRPPSEASSILLRLTRNCPWNRCAFCPVYKGQKFSLRTPEEIRHDIDSMYFIAAEILKCTSESGIINGTLMQDIASTHGIGTEYIQQVAFWLHHGMESLFLQDADSLIMKTTELVDILKYIREKFPTIKRITSYARAHTVSRKSPEELRQLREAGLNRIHIGMESGSDSVLEMIQKGVTAERQIDAGRKAMDAGFELSQYFMPGSGGTEFSGENARESARVLSAINPTFIRLRSTIPVPGTPLHDLMLAGKWTPVPEEDKVREIRLFIENLDNITSVLKSDHIMNLIEDIEGSLPADRSFMTGVIDSFFNMDPGDRETYIVGRRTGRYRYLRDFRPDRETEILKQELKNKYGSLDAAILEILTNYI